MEHSTCPDSWKHIVILLEENGTTLEDFSGASSVAHTEKNLPKMQDTGVQSLGREDSLEKGMATHSSILA